MAFDGPEPSVYEELAEAINNVVNQEDMWFNKVEETRIAMGDRIGNLEEFLSWFDEDKDE